jgi:homoserine O-acetyltransferase
MITSLTPPEPIDIDSGVFLIDDFQLESGPILPRVRIAYETYGTPNSDLTNVVLLTHGYTSSHHMARGSGAGLAEGVWSALIGPGQAIDTDVFFVISSNMLGSCYGSTGPGELNPETGKPYGPDFPDISVVDIVTAQKLLIDSLQIRRLLAIVGPSYGGFQAFQWAVSFPDAVIGIVPVTSDYKAYHLAEEDLSVVTAQLEADPNWNNGHFYDAGGVTGTMENIRYNTLTRYGMDSVLSGELSDKKSRDRAVRENSRLWAKEFDAHSLLVLGRASARFSVESDLESIRARVLLILARTDDLFPPSLAVDSMRLLTNAGVVADYFEIDTEYGHSSSGTDAAKWSKRLESFLDECRSIAMAERQ